MSIKWDWKQAVVSDFEEPPPLEPPVPLPTPRPVAAPTPLPQPLPARAGREQVAAPSPRQPVPMPVYRQPVTVGGAYYPPSSYMAPSEEEEGVPATGLPIPMPPQQPGGFEQYLVERGLRDVAGVIPGVELATRAVKREPLLQGQGVGRALDILGTTADVLPLAGLGIKAARPLARAAGRGATRAAEALRSISRLATEEGGFFRTPWGTFSKDKLDVVEEMTRQLDELDDFLRKGVGDILRSAEGDFFPLTAERSRVISETEEAAEIAIAERTSIINALKALATEEGGFFDPTAARLRRPPTPPPPGGGIPPTAAAGEADPIARLTTLIKAARPARAQTEALKTAELSKRVGAASQMLEAGVGEEAFGASTAALKGQLPTVPFEPARGSFTSDELLGLFEKIRTSELPYFTKLNTQGALTKLLNGEVPQRAEIGLLEDMFGKDLAKAILKRDVSGWQRAREALVNIAGIPRTIVASVDISAPFRQGLLFWRHPEWRSAWGPMLKSFAKEKNAEAVDAAIKAGKYYDSAVESGLYLAPLQRGVGRALTTAEELFTSNLPQKIKIFGWSPIRASERAYVSFLNKLRADTFAKYAAEWEGMGKTAGDFKRLASYINAATGRGSLGKFEAIAPELNVLFFSPRFAVSRFQVLGQLGRETAKGGIPELRNIIAKDIASTLAAGTGILSLFAIGGAKVELDPRSPDFGKARIGNTRIDFWGGFQPLFRYLATAAAGTGKSSRTGQIYEIDPVDVMARFVQSKLAPTPSLFLDLWRGKTFAGEPVTLSDEMVKTLVPLLIQDVTQAVQQEGLVGLPIGALSAVGIGVQSYEPEEEPQAPRGGFQFGTPQPPRINAGGFQFGGP